MPAQGADERALAALLAKIEHRGLHVTGYKRPCLRRRLAVRMRARGVHDYQAYARLLDAVPEELDLLIDALTINVTKFFRNPETYAALAERVVPELAAQSRPARVWSAGCASGEEPYSLAILLREHAPPLRGRIHATDLDPGALALLRAASYPEAAVEDVPPDLLARYFSPGPPFRLAPGVTRLVEARQHDLTTESPPAPPYDLIVCRNVVIYFDRPTQERIFRSFFDALRPGGWLLLGKVETLFGPTRALFRIEDPRERLFRRPA